jgi:hypothetical protein
MNRTTPSSAQLSPGWVAAHVPAPGSFRDYDPKPVDFDDSREGDFAHGSEAHSDAGLRRIDHASRTEAERLERSYR